MTKDRKNSWGGIDAIPPIYQIKDNSSNKNNIFVMREDLIPISMGGNKVRIAAEFFLDMEEKGCDVMVAYGNLRSNLCRVIANQCYRKKIPCYIICSKEETDEEELETSNSRMMKLFDAKLVLCNKNNIAETVEKTLHEIEAGGHRPYYIYGNKYGTGNEGVPAGAYAKAYGKIKAFEKEARCSFDYIFHASGTGGTQAGLTCGRILEGDSAKVVGILISSRTYERAIGIIREGAQSYMERIGKTWDAACDQEIHLAAEYTKGGYGVYDDEIISCIRRELQENSLPLDPVYTGKAFLGMQKYLADHEISGKNVLFIHTGGTPLFYDCLSDGQIK